MAVCEAKVVDFFVLNKIPYSVCTSRFEGYYVEDKFNWILIFATSIKAAMANEKMEEAAEYLGMNHDDGWRFTKTFDNERQSGRRGEKKAASGNVLNTKPDAISFSQCLPIYSLRGSAERNSS